MKHFGGFPNKMDFTPLPNIFFSDLLPNIGDITELQVTLHVFRELYPKKGYPRFVSYSELLGNLNVMNSLKETGTPPEEALFRALEMANERGTFLHLRLDRDGVSEDIYFLNNESNRQAIAKVQNGELKLSGLKAVAPASANTEPQPDIFTIYEQNIGMLTPMIVEELREAKRLYPEGWISDAIREAVSLNKHNCRYITRILEHWWSEGKESGTHRRDPAKQAGPDKYIKQKYGHMVKR
jgi:DNA replication protein